MKQFTMVLALAAFSLGLQAQEYNLFDKEDVDKDGWLWFDTQEKVDKYIGLCDEENFKVDPKGKLIQMVYADQAPEYPPTTVDPTFIGAGKGGDLGAEGAKKGAIILPSATALGATNGGGFVVLMPSCATFSINFSSEGNVYCRIRSTDDVSTVFSKYGIRKVFSMFNKLSGAGNNTKKGIESLTSGNDNITIKSDKPVYAYFENDTKGEVYIHGIKVTTQTEVNTGIEDVIADKGGKTEVYTINGVKVGNSTSNLAKGLYIVKAGDTVKKITIK